MARIFGKIVDYHVFRNLFFSNFSEKRNIFIETRIKSPTVLCDINNDLYLASHVTFKKNIHDLSLLKNISNSYTMSLNNIYDRYFRSGLYFYKKS